MSAVQTATLVGREYLRVSKDRSGEGRSPDQQHADNAEAFAERDWRLHQEPYRDVDRSASRYARRAREDFGRLLADLEAGTFGADVLVLWEASRGSRTMAEWVTLLDLLPTIGVRIFVTSNERLYDPTNPTDRKELLNLAADGEYESAKTSKRIRRNTKATAKEGKPHGKFLYGYKREYDPETRAFVRQVPDPETADVVREAARMVLAGVTCYGVTKEFNSRGIPPRRESFTERRRELGWTVQAVREMLSNPAYAALRRHVTRLPDGSEQIETYEAVWEPLIPRADWEKLQALFATRTRTNDWTTRHLLTGIATCGVCGALVRRGKQNAGSKKDPETGRRARIIDPETGRPRYYDTYECKGVPGKGGFHVSMRVSHLDYAISEAVIARMERPDFLAMLGQKDETVDEERAQLLAQIKERRDYLDQVRDEAARRRRLDLLVDQEERIQPEIENLEERVKRLAATDPLVIDLARSGTVRKIWDADAEEGGLTLEERRRVIRAVIVPVIDRIDPKDKGKRGLNTARLERSVWK